MGKFFPPTLLLNTERQSYRTMKQDPTDSERAILKEVYERLLDDSQVSCSIDDDGDLALRKYFSPEVAANIAILCQKFGYVIREYFYLGDKKHKYVLTKKANEITDNTREGAFFIDKDSEVAWKHFIPYSDSIGATDIIRAYKAGIETFLLHLGEFIEAMEEDVSDDGTVILDVVDDDDGEEDAA